jgi:hypothetical protein
MTLLEEATAMLFATEDLASETGTTRRSLIVSFKFRSAMLH